MKVLAISVLAFLAAFASYAAGPPAYEAAKADAEKLFADKSFARAHEAYEAIDPTNLPAAEQRWVEFRRADTQWRAQAATQTSDPTQLDEARHQLEVLIRDVTREQDHDRVWAEVQESLGDFFLVRRNANNIGQAWPYYQQALEWWAGAADVRLARERYLAIVWRAERPPGVDRNFVYGSWGYNIPLPVLDNAAKIAQTTDDQAHAHYLIASTIRATSGDWEQRARVPDEFEAAIAAGKGTDWYDDALYNYAAWMADQGRIVPLANGGWQPVPDYPKALELFHRFVTEFKEGESRYYNQANQEIHNITDPQLSVSLPNIFLPDSEIQYSLNWRNVKQISLSLYPVDLNRDVHLSGDESHPDWLQSINLAGREQIKSWTRDTRDKGDYQPGGEMVPLDGKLKPGAYVLEARAGGRTARDLVLVTDGTLVLKASGRQALIYFCNALNSAPFGGGAVKLWERWYDNEHWHVHEQSKSAGSDGIAVFDLTNRNHNNAELFATVTLGDRQAFSTGNGYGPNNDADAWKIYAFTDRPAYRPQETAQWKFIARRYNGSIYSTPGGQTVEYEITDPRGTMVKTGEAKLNQFGSAWGSLELTAQMPLGEYQVAFWNQGHKQPIGNAVLFRLEEYKLPEFKVTVQTPDETNSIIPGAAPRKKAFRLGETVEVSVQADYYFGGPVANAEVEVLVHQQPLWRRWHSPREFPWFYEDMDNPNGRWYGGDQIIKRETLKTDAAGKVTVSFDTPRGSGQDLEFRIEARVTDSSRREITGTGSVRVTQQRYYVYPEPEHNLYHPQDQVAVNFKAVDANEQPIATEGTVKVTRDYWFEVWVTPDGKEIKGDELKLLQARAAIWPPAPVRPDEPGWRLKSSGYEHDDILTQSLKTDTNGEARLSFTPEREGYYRIAWAGEDTVSNRMGRLSSPIAAETTVWVATRATADLGYHYGGVQIIADKDTFRVGQTAPVMLVSPTSDRYVLFTVEGDDLYHYQLVHLDGTVKLVELPVDEKLVPNVFLNATLVQDRQMFTDSKQIVVPPVKNFITVDVKPDRAQYQPRDDGTFTITTRNDRGEPVPAEVAFGLADESVYYIQDDYAGDPRQFYFGTKRSQQVQTGSTMYLKGYARLVKGEKDQLLDERELERDKENLGNNRNFLYQDRIQGGFGGGRGGGGFGGFGFASGQMDMAKSAAGEPVLMNRAVGGRSDLAYRLADSAAAGPSEKPAAPPEGPAVQVRSDFRSTVAWQPDVATGKDGTATVKITYPDSLTGWKATARAVSTENQFGIASAATHTKQPLIVRLEAPRFFVVGDTVTLSAVVNNNTAEPMDVRVTLEVPVTNSAPTLAVRSVNGTSAHAPTTVHVAPGAEARVDWTADVKSSGEAHLKVTGRGGIYGDAMEKSYTVYEHGIEKFISKSGKARGDEVTVKLDLPKERRAGTTTLTVQVTPSLAVTMLDALPYLIDYPYGCTEQTMSRFLPAAITAKTLRDLGLKPEDIMGRAFGGIEPASAAATHPKGKRDLAELDAVTKASLDRLYDFQHGDGGWGWWKEGSSDHWMTAYVVWGLALARTGGVTVNQSALDRGADFLDKHLVEEEDGYDMQAFMLHALTTFNVAMNRSQMSAFQEKAFANLWKNRDQLNAYTRALLALAAHDSGKTTEAATLIQNLENGVVRDNHPDNSVLIQSAGGNSTPAAAQGTAHWGEDGIYWRWSDSGVEATAFTLRALLAIDPHNALVEPVANWLLQNRRGAQWNNTRDTAIVVLTMNDYLRASGELKGGTGYELLVNGHSIAKKTLSGADMFDAPSRFTIDSALVSNANEIRIRRTSGDGPLYFAAEAKFFSLEEPITAAGNGIFVKRDYFKLAGRPSLLKGIVYDREPLRDGETVKSGERVETVLTIEAKNNYEYLLFEDLKPAGLEATEVRSGESLFARELKSGAIARATAQGTNTTTSTLLSLPDEADFTDRTRWVYEELRDRKVALFIDKLPQGIWQIRYDLRAEVPGQFHALPVLGQAMYVPEIRCNGAEIHVRVQDNPL
jgi:alpha-2-macroglobulin